MPSVFWKVTVRPFSGSFSGPDCPKMALFGLEMLFFLGYAHITHFFGVRQTWLNGIISSPYPKVTLDAFGIPVDARLSARLVVFWHQLPKMGLFGLKMLFFLRYAHTTHFFGFRQTRINGIISSPYPKVILHAFGFPVGARLSARQPVFWPRLPKMALFAG